MNEERSGVSVGILNGLVYAVGGSDESGAHKSVEVYNPKTGVWSFVANMKKCRWAAGND